MRREESSQAAPSAKVVVDEANSSKPKRATQSSNSQKVPGEQQSPAVNVDQASAALVSVLNWNVAAWKATAEDGPIACSSELVLADSGATHVIKCVHGGLLRQALPRTST